MKVQITYAQVKAALAKGFISPLNSIKKAVNLIRSASKWVAPKLVPFVVTLKSIFVKKKPVTPWHVIARGRVKSFNRSTHGVRSENKLKRAST